MKTKSLRINDKSKRSRKNNRGIFYSDNCLIVIALIVAVLAVLIFHEPIIGLLASNNNINSNEAVRDKLPKLCSILTNIAPLKLITKKWKVGGSFMRGLAKDNIPIKIINSSITNWEIYKLDLLNISKIDHFYFDITARQQIPLFLLSHNREKGGMIGSPKDRPLIYINTTFTFFLESLFNPNIYLLYITPLKNWENKIHTQLTGNSPAEGNWESFKIIEKDIESTIDAEASDEVNSAESLTNKFKSDIIFTHPGVIQQLKYSTHHTIINQIIGALKILIFPPDHEFHVYPNIHQNYRYSQIFFDDSSNCTKLTTTFSHILSMQNISYFELFLHPGESLYIPPYWYSYQLSTTLSLSVTVTSPSAIETKLANTYWSPVPLGPFTSSLNLRKAAILHYLSLLLKEVGITENIKNFSYNLYQSRFVFLYSQKSREFPNLCLENYNGNFDDNITNLIDTHKEDFNMAVRSIANQLLFLNSSKNNEIIKLNFLSDYFEEIVRWAVGPEKTAQFIKNCF